MSNIIEETIERNEKKYEESKEKLKSIIDDSMTRYSQIKKEFNNGKKQINSDKYLNNDGKRVQIEKLSEDCKNRAYKESGKNIDRLLNQVAINITELEMYKLEKQGLVKEEILPSLTYVSSIINLINRVEDADILNEVYDYIGNKYNFSEEVMNLVYMKAKSILNIPLDGEELLPQDPNLMSRVNSRNKLQKIVSTIKKYKYDYIKDFKDMEFSFRSWKSQKKQPSNLYFATDIRNDLSVITDPWKR